MKIHELISKQEVEQINEAGLGALGSAVGTAVKSGGGKLLSKTLGKLSGAGSAGSGALKFFSTSNKIMTLLSALGIGKIVWDYNTTINQAHKMVEKGDWTEQDFQDFRQGEMTKLVLEIASSTALFTFLKLSSGWSVLATACRYNPLGITAVKAFGAFMGATSEAARLAFVGFLLSPKGQEARQAVADLIGRGIIDNTIGGNVVALVDKVKHFFDASQKDGEWKSPLAPAGGNADAGADAGADTTTPAKAAKDADDASSYDYDKTRYTRSPSGALVSKFTPSN